MNTKLDILKKIKIGEVVMKPRWHFVLKSLLLLLSSIVAALLVVYVLSFILFFLRQSGVGFMPLYGFRGVSMFVMNSPWLLIASAGALIVVLQLLVHKYSFSYRQPQLYSMFGVILLMLFGAYAIEQTQFQSQMRGLTENRNTPVLSSLYREIDQRRPENIIFGTITEITNSGFVLESDRAETLNVVTTEATKQSPNKRYSIDETVLVFGDRTGTSTIEALGIRPAPEDFNRYRFNNKERGTMSGRERPLGSVPNSGVKN